MLGLTFLIPLLITVPPVLPATQVELHSHAFDAQQPGVDPKDLPSALRALRIRRVLFWRLLPAYSERAVEQDLARLRSLYLSKGYFDARVQLKEADLRGKNSRIIFNVASGPRYPMSDPCPSLLAARREAERQGILDFAATLDAAHSGEPTIELGSAYRVGRIRFIGNHHWSDAMLRRSLQLHEGHLFDSTLLRKSIERLNRSMLFEPLTERDVAIFQDEISGVADVAIRLTERKRGAWNISGPLGPASFAGPLQASIGSRLPPWGSGMLALGTYAASISVFAFARPLVPLLSVSPKRPVLPVLALARPFSPSEGWRSGFSIAPQLGWRATVLSYFVTQAQQRLIPSLAGGRGLTPELPVTVNAPSGDGVLFCEAPTPKLTALRTAATLTLQFLGTFAGF